MKGRRTVMLVAGLLVLILLSWGSVAKITMTDAAKKRFADNAVYKQALEIVKELGVEIETLPDGTGVSMTTTWERLATAKMNGKDYEVVLDVGDGHPCLIYQTLTDTTPTGVRIIFTSMGRMGWGEVNLQAEGAADELARVLYSFLREAVLQRECWERQTNPQAGKCAIEAATPFANDQLLVTDTHYALFDQALTELRKPTLAVLEITTKTAAGPTTKTISPGVSKVTVTAGDEIRFAVYGPLNHQYTVFQSILLANKPEDADGYLGTKTGLCEIRSLPIVGVLGISGAVFTYSVPTTDASGNPPAGKYYLQVAIAKSDTTFATAGDCHVTNIIEIVVK